MATLHDFQTDSQGRRFADVLKDQELRAALVAALAEMNTPEGRLAMADAEEIHNRPALVGVVKRIEASPAFACVCARHDRSGIGRLKQAIGVGCRITMAENGWNTTGRKGSLRRLSQHFSVAERYTRG
jgi:hypothetical protein